MCRSAHPAPLEYSINSILYQRGIYPPESFTQVKKYGLTILCSTDPLVKEFLSNITGQVQSTCAGRGSDGRRVV